MSFRCLFWVVAVGLVSADTSLGNEPRSAQSAPVVAPVPPDLRPVTQGTLRLELNGDALAQAGVRVMERAGVVEDAAARPGLYTFEVIGGAVATDASDPVRPIRELQATSRGALLLEVQGRRVTIGNLALVADSENNWTLRNELSGAELSEPFLIDDVFIDAAGSELIVQASLLLGEWPVDGAGDLLITRTGTTIGRIEAVLVLGTATGPQDEDPGEDDTPFQPLASGPDVIVGDLHETNSYGSDSGFSAFSVGTVSCNIGDTPLNWYANTNEHPVIAQNMYRLKDGRFEQIGQSWLKHGFFALSGTLCSGPGGCTGDPTGEHLGVGCSDPYSATLNGSQSNLGPRSQVNPSTGEYPYPFTAPPAPAVIGRRLQVANSDLEPSLNQGAQYFVEGQYVASDDAGSGNDLNNASYRPINVNGSGSSFSIALTGQTERMRPAVDAWAQADPSVTITSVAAPRQETFYVAGKATDLGDGFWSYEYAVYNLNSDRACGSFSVPISASTLVRNLGFHDVDSHSGEPYDATDWPGFVGAAEVLWATDDFAVDPDANALRWGTLYNFRFEANAPPEPGDVTLGLFKPGTPADLAATVVVPGSVTADCNGNTIIDTCDISCGPAGGACDVPGCGQSADCSGNGIPDECEADSDGDGVPNTCDACPGFDDLLDSDQDGVADGCDACPGFDDTIDPDQDGFPSQCDNCPADANPSQADADSDGIGNVCDPDFCDPQPANEHFAVDPGWTVVVDGAIDGNWDWGVPIGGGDRQDPPDDFDGGGACYLTDNVDGNSDVDGGSTRLVSPEYALAAGDVTLSYAYWIGTTDTGSDVLRVEVSEDGGASWITAATYTANEQAWLVEIIDVRGILPSAETLRVRFSATDGGPATVLEAGIDAFEISVACNLDCSQTGVCNDGNPCTDDQCVEGACQFVPNTLACDDGDICTTGDVCSGGQCLGGPPPPCTETDCTDCNINGVRDDCEGLPDCDNNGIPDTCEFADCNGNGTNDLCDIAGGTSSDCDGGPIGDLDAGTGLFGSSCVFCHGANGTGGFGPNIRGKSRVEIWNKLLPPTTHAGGIFPELGPQDFADLEVFLSDSGGTPRPDRIPDECQSLLDCDGDGASDACEFGAGTQVDLDLNGAPDGCEFVAAPTPDPFRKNRYVSFVPGAGASQSDVIVQAFRITSADYPGWSKWVDLPDANGIARLACEPVYLEWPLAMVHVGDADILPDTLYQVQAIRAGFDPADESFFSAPVDLWTTAVWGDVAGDVVDGAWTGPNGVVNGLDVIACLQQFGQRAPMPPAVWVDLDGAVPDKLVNGRDILQVVNAFQTVPYPFGEPAPCP